MLREIRVERFALVEKLTVRFEAGLNVLTGETGAGKSLLVDALGLAVGGRARADLVRAGEKDAVVEALFEPEEAGARRRLDQALEARGLPASDGMLVVRRLVDARGRHRVHLNGALATVATLSEIAGALVDICGQHEHLALARPGAALSFVDAFAAATDPAFVRARDVYAEAWNALETARSALAGLEVDPVRRAEREAFLRFQLSEIENLKPEPDELDHLETERRRLAGARRLHGVAAEAEDALYGGDAAVGDVLARVRQRLEEVTAVDPALVPLVEALRDAGAVVAEVGRELGDYARRMEDDPQRLEAVEARITHLKQLARRHGGDLAAAVAAAGAMRAELEDLEAIEARLDAATQAVAQASGAALSAAGDLGAARGRAAASLTEATQGRLASLAMAGSRIEVRVRTHTDAARLGEAGADEVSLGLSAGADEPLRPLGRVASGGELARILLALRRTLADVDPVSTCVFDEVDTGIGGAVAEVVGRLLAEVARGRQVLCVTHLPQVAAQGHHHLVMRKIAGPRPRIEAAEVRGPDRAEELARMLGGVEVTRRTRAHAREILERASAPRPPASRPSAPQPPARDDGRTDPAAPARARGRRPRVASAARGAKARREAARAGAASNR
jgi:DNA repair protein RecN (Recombination protein N)